MRKWLLLIALVLVFPLSSAAQVVPRAALFGGYTWAHAKFNDTNAGFSQNGWDGSLEVKPMPLVGFVADVSRHYATPNGIQENQTSFLFGPQISIPGSRRVIPFAHVMAGVVHGTNEQLTCTSLTTPCGVLTGNAFATAVGGGVDFKLGGPLWIRAIQADWMHAHLDPDHRTRVRLATGFVLRFGR